MRPYRDLALSLSCLILGARYRCKAFTPTTLSRISSHPTVLNASVGGRRSFVANSIASSAAAALFTGSSISAPAVAADVDSMRTLEEIDPSKTKIALWGFGNQNKLMAKYLSRTKVPGRQRRIAS
jgi:hypothetical protein